MVAMVVMGMVAAVVGAAAVVVAALDVNIILASAVSIRRVIFAASIVRTHKRRVSANLVDAVTRNASHNDFRLLWIAPHGSGSNTNRPLQTSV